VGAAAVQVAVEEGEAEVRWTRPYRPPQGPTAPVTDPCDSFHRAATGDGNRRHSIGAEWNRA